MSVSQSHLRANAKHQSEKLSRITIQPYKEEAQQIKEAALASGMSVTQYILKAVRAQMGADKSAEV